MAQVIMDNKELILTIVRNTETKLDAHIDSEAARYKTIDSRLDKHRDDINDLEKDAALTKQRLGVFSAGISLLVAGVFTWFANIFGVRS